MAVVLLTSFETILNNLNFISVTFRILVTK